MRKQLTILILLSLIVTLGGCGKSDKKASSENPIKGKFALASFREGNHVNDTSTYVLRGSELKKISQIASSPVWSPSGSKILTRDKDKNVFFIYDEYGLLIKEIQTLGYPIRFDWFPGEDKIIYVGKEKLNEKWDSICHLLVYDLATDTQQEIHTFVKNQTIFSLFLSPDGSKVVFYAAEDLGKKAPSIMAVIDLQTLQMREYAPKASVLGWFPDGKRFAIETNIKEDGTKFNELLGILGEINVETGEFKIIKNVREYYLDAQLSKDGKYIYYIKGLDTGGQAVFVQPIGSYEEYQVTQPSRFDNGAYSQDFHVSWYQGD
jgi:Tol biopolymer transport system component